MNEDLTSASLGQYFTPPDIVRFMLGLRQNQGKTLEPACGDGAFLRHLKNEKSEKNDVIAIEIDGTKAPKKALVMNFFAYQTTTKFATIIGNPPYVRQRDIPRATRLLTKESALNLRANLYLFFIERCLDLLAKKGELIFITPRDFLKASSAVILNKKLAKLGTITDFIDLGDAKFFKEAAPNCAIWRFEKDNFTRKTRFAAYQNAYQQDFAKLCFVPRYFVENGGHLSFAEDHYPLTLSEIAFVKVGAVSGADDIFTHENGNRQFVSSETQTTGKTRRMIWCTQKEAPPDILMPHKARLLARKVKKFSDKNWWVWGRNDYSSAAPRVYVNNKTRRANPFFVHTCTHYDGSVLAIFPRNPKVNVRKLAFALNFVNWADLGFICDGRYLFTQRSLERAPLPENFREFLPKNNV